MITRKLLAATLGFGLLAGTFGAASAQTTPAPTTPVQTGTNQLGAAPAKGTTKTAKDHRKHMAHHQNRKHLKNAKLNRNAHVAAAHTARHGSHKHA